MRRSVVLLLALSFLFASVSEAQENSQQPTSAASPSLEISNSKAVTFLQQSHDLNPQFNLGTRIYLLQRQAEAVSRADTELGRAWAQELFALSRQTKGELRSFVENSAMSILVRLNPDQALAMLHNLSKNEPQANSTPSMPNMKLVQRVFDVLVERDGVSALPVLEQEAALMGSDGPYPYGALGHAAVQSVSKEWATNRPRAVEIVQQVFERAYARYHEGARTYADDYEFGRMLQEVSGGIPAESVRPALRMLVGNLLTTDTSKYRFQAGVYTEDGKTAKADNSVDAAILNLGGLINRIDPELAQQLESTRPELQTALPYTKDGRQKLSFFGGGRRPQTVNGRPLDSDAENAMDAVRLTNINLEAAIAKAEQLPQGARRADTILEIAREIARNQPDRASELIAEVEGSNEQGIPELQLDVISVKTSVAAAQDKKDEIGNLLHQGFDLANAIIAKSRKSEDFSFLPGIGQLVQIGMQSDADSTITFVESVPASWLKANLLLAVAGALDKQGQKPINPSGPQKSEKSNL